MPLHRGSRRALVGVLLVGSLVVLPGPGVASARKLSVGRARTAAYHLAVRVGRKAGAVYAVAGYCKRKSRTRVNCWAGIIFSNYYGAAQRVRVTQRGRKVRAVKYGHVYKGYVGSRSSGQSSSEWAICGIHSSVCIGS